MSGITNTVKRIITKNKHALWTALATNGLGQGNGRTIYKTKDIRADKGYVDNQNPNVYHWDLQINRETEDATLKKAIGKNSGTHKKLGKFTFDTENPPTQDELVNNIVNGI
ncbi:unnamed protein product [Cyclocybe aegerita]|uniref:Uncharacterized protein n=1 Tax=Cyclocybe aegerita TaxID=1973307 RepID=A0A8S0WLT3_CYCAE|nr:unnamed protein product [Cyclocybe aegerita]